MDEVQKAIADDLANLRESVDHRAAAKVHISDKRIKRILRLRLIGYTRAYPVWELSYCWAELKDGTRVRVDLDRDEFSREYKRELIEVCKKHGVYGRGIGILDAVDTWAG